MPDHPRESLASGQSPFGKILSIDTPLGDSAVILTSLDGEDALSRCFLYRIGVVAGRPAAQVESLLGKPVTLWLANLAEERRRPIHGLVRRVLGNGRDAHGNQRYRMEVVPALWFLNCSVDCRIFQHQTLPAIVRSVLAEHGLTDVEFRIVWDQYKEIEYCVQYRESALSFVSRLLEHLGLFYWHEHDADRHLLVIGDRNAATPSCEPPRVDISDDPAKDVVRTIDADHSFRPGKWTLNDYDFEAPAKQLVVDTHTILTVPHMADHEIYEYPGDFRELNAGRDLSRLRVEMEEAQHLRVFGAGQCIGFDPGRRVAIGAISGTQGTGYLLTEVRHRATSPGLESEDSSDHAYSNEFTAIEASLPFRPERSTPKPFMRGPQTATVVGPAGENIHCDKYGRVRVQFHWDRRGKKDERSSCWMRVSQARSGSHYGTLTIPHVGHEVVVSFIDGDPDRPLISGTVANALTMPPVELPADKDKTVQRDHGDNKIVMHGKAGQEYLTVVSPRAMNVFASGRTARPLSASAAPGSGPGGGANFDAIDGFKDGEGLRQLRGEWFRQAAGNSVDTGVRPPVPTPEPDGTVTGTYLNWGSAGKINCVVLGNHNLWVGAQANTWVAGDSNTKIKGDNESTIEGGSTTTVGSVDHLSYDNYHVYGNKWEMTAGSKEDTVGINRTELTIGAKEDVVAGGLMELILGPQFHFSTGLDVHKGRSKFIMLETLVANTRNAITVTNTRAEVAELRMDLVAEVINRHELLVVQARDEIRALQGNLIIM